jgi:4-hydroxyphenylacetate 3-monooxygenase
MIRMGEQYRDSIRDGRQVWINGERVKDVTAHPMFRPLVDVRARIYDMQHDPRFADALSYCTEAGEVCAVALKLPRTRADWCAKRAAVEAVLNDIGGVVTRVGDETVGEMWSLFDGQDILDEVDPAFSENIRRHVDRVVRLDPFHVSANTDPKGDRSKRPQEQDPDMLLHVVKETDAGIVVRREHRSLFRESADAADDWMAEHVSATYASVPIHRSYRAASKKRPGIPLPVSTGRQRK